MRAGSGAPATDSGVKAAAAIMASISSDSALELGRTEVAGMGAEVTFGSMSALSLSQFIQGAHLGIQASRRDRGIHLRYGTDRSLWFWDSGRGVICVECCVR